MRFLLTLILCITLVNLQAQQLPSGLPQRFMAHWYQFQNYVSVEKGLGIPLVDTNWTALRAGYILRNPNDGIVYISNGNTTGKKWDPIGSGGAADGNNYPTALNFNTTTKELTLSRSGLSDLTASIPYPDIPVDEEDYRTATQIDSSMYSLNRPNGTKTVFKFTGGIITPTTEIRKVDTFWRTPGIDSLYFKINGDTYAILDSTGGSSTTPTLDAVLSIGNTSTNFMNIDAVRTWPSYTSNWVGILGYSGNGTIARGNITLRTFSTGGGYFTTVYPGTLTNYRSIEIPDEDGIMATREWVLAQGYTFNRIKSDIILASYKENNMLRQAIDKLYQMVLDQQKQIDKLK